MAYIEKIFGAPGTGKTHNLVKRLQEHLDKNCPFDKTLTISFTRVASRHIRGRISKKNKFTDKELMQNVRTIDSYLMNKIREDKEICYGAEFLKEFYGVRKEKEINDDKKYAFYKGMNIIDKGRITIGDGIENILIHYDSLKHPAVGRRSLIRLFESYNNYKKNHFKMDWIDVKYKGLNPKVRFEDNIVLMVDEAQDCNRLEWLVINKLIAVSEYVYIAGDDDQAIYRFKGGEVETFLKLKANKTTVLDESPRLNKKIWELAQAAIHLIPEDQRQEKKYRPINENKYNMPHCGLIHKFRNKESFEKNYLDMNITDPEIPIHWLILARTNTVLDMKYSQELYSWSQILAKNYFTWEVIDDSNGVSTGIERGTSPNVPQDQINGIETWLSLQKGELILGKNVKEFYKIIPANFIRDRKKTSLISKDSIILNDGKYNYGDLKSKFYLDANINAPWSETLNLKPKNKDHYVNYFKYLEKIFENGNYKKSEKILLSTIHGAKGLEAANTILNCDWTYKPYETYCKGEKDRDDEIRVFYVGITRTKYNLFLYQPDFSLGEYRGMKHNNFWNKIRGK